MRAALDGLTGIIEIRMDLARDAFLLVYDPARLDTEDVVGAVAGLGFTARIASDGPAAGASVSESPGPGPLPEPLAAAVAAARRDDRLILADFHAAWCAPCKVIEEKVLPAPAVRHALRRFVLVRVDTDDHPEAARALRVVALPTLVVLDGAGRELSRLEGPVDAAELVRMLDAAGAP